ncbi:hypothetical protein ABZ934_14940 [Streptomyces sp. NPDC046557]|uniref:hypothetical protein n=1 Tax=Streptomyces sp. NPDC046557 TaxID=3155372 RepID=UPI0033F3EDB4
MPIDPYAALNAMLRAEAARSTPPPARHPETAKAGRATGPDTGRPGNAAHRPAGATPAE